MPSGREGVVEATSSLDEHAERPAIADDLVHGDEEEVFLLGQAHQASPDEGTLREVEGMERFFLNELVSDSLLLGARQRAQIVERQRHDQLRRNDLHVSTVDDGEGRAQNFVAAHDFVDAPLQDRHVACDVSRSA